MITFIHFTIEAAMPTLYGKLHRGHKADRWKCTEFGVAIGEHWSSGSTSTCYLSTRWIICRCSVQVTTYLSTATAAAAELTTWMETNHFLPILFRLSAFRLWFRSCGCCCLFFFYFIPHCMAPEQGADKRTNISMQTQSAVVIVGQQHKNKPHANLHLRSTPLCGDSF